ncbi:hypothetical protein EVJ58_g4537 [Rhodofomes roseus]|uniref:Methylated-DNA-[protein]-cysteine S-methyltransferase DNA binding domain-containing protein n=1 Tax=Rhodofomes roseus TaxID=34475 RepID=A0A4Y9YHC5_9APHY|nr:hypothetical protein EVJ58_g4537 [Rhodofomes roseus]
MPRHSRHVGQALKFVSPDVQPPIPWYRVIASSGMISSRGPGTTGADRQRQELEAEGIEVNVGRMGDLRVDLRRYGWFPAPGTVDTDVELNEDGEADVDASEATSEDGGDSEEET